MPLYRYAAKDNAGRTVRGRLEAIDERSLVVGLRQRGLAVISVQADGTGGVKSRLGFLSGRPPLRELVLFSRQIATMINAGIPLLQGLEILAEQTEDRAFRRTLTEVKKSVSAGASLSHALAKERGVFSELFISMVRAGEESGGLDEIMERLAGYIERTQKLVGKVKSAMIYPTLLSVMALGITLLLMVKVIPVFKDMYADLGGELPGPTRILIEVSDFLVRNLVGAGIAVFLSAVTVFYLSRTKYGGYLADQIKLKIPIFGTLARKLAISKFARTLATLIRSGVSILSALEITAKTSGNRVIERAVERVKTSIREGEDIAEPLKASGVFPPMVVRMVSVGEKSGELEKMLTKIADFYEDQVDTAVAGLTSIIEPVLIGFLGIVIGGIVIAMFLPIFSLTKLLSV